MIDFVIPWVNGNDPEWLEEKAKFSEGVNAGNSSCRFRNWDNLQYWFRGVEKFAPWVNRIHFITWGHLPPWLNILHEKLNVVKHTDYIPPQYLPTFNSHTIELNMHRIKGLSERFVYFNDDTFILNELKPNDFFKNNLPRDGIRMVYSTPDRNNIFAQILLNNIEGINANFNKRLVQKRKRTNWVNFKYDLKSNVFNLIFYFFKTFPGFHNPHLPVPFLKSTLQEVWRKEEAVLHETCNRKFRNNQDVSQYVFRYWQLASGKFSPANMRNYGKAFHLGADERELFKTLEGTSKLMICANDAINHEEEFLNLKNQLNGRLSQRLPQKSSFEL